MNKFGGKLLNENEKERKVLLEGLEIATSDINSLDSSDEDAEDLPDIYKGHNLEITAHVDLHFTGDDADTFNVIDLVQDFINDAGMKVTITSGHQKIYYAEKKEENGGDNSTKRK